MCPGFRLAILGVRVVPIPRLVNISSGGDRGARRNANRRGRVRIRKARAACRQPVDVWRSDSRVSITAKDIFSLSKPIKSAGHGPASAKDLMLRTTLDLLGVEYKNVTGYGSAGKIRAAILKADVDMTADSMTGYISRVAPNLVDTGHSIPLYSLGVPAADGTMQRAPGSLEDVPTFDEFYEAKFGKRPSGPEYDVLRVIGQIRATALRAVVIPKGAPEETVSLLREAFKATLEDPLFQEDFKKIAGFVPVGLSGADAQARFNALMDTDAETIDFLKAYSEKARR